MILNKVADLLYRVFLIGLITSSLITPANATLIYNVSFNDPNATYSSFYDNIRSHVIASGAKWSNHIVGDADLEVQISFSNSTPRATGRSFASSFVRNSGDLVIIEQGAAGEINTGIDPNGSAPDIDFTIGSDYLMNELWFDPDPVSRTATVDINKTDAVSVFLHEFGHAFAFNSRRDSTDGSLSDIFLSTFDDNIIFDGSDLLFQGEKARNVYGGDVPLTFGNSTHVGNLFPRPGEDLIPDLMNGVVFVRGSRYDISELDLAILADSGLTVVPIPAAVWLFSSGLIGLLGIRKKSSAVSTSTPV